MFIFKCKMCGGNLVAGEIEGVGRCDSCGSTMTIPSVSDERRVNLFNRATHFRILCEFDKALATYEMILNENDKDAEAHWGVVLCRYGIEYVEDPDTHRRIPTCHRLQYDSVQSDSDYLAVLEHARDDYTRNLYKKEAAAIAELQKAILSVSKQEEGYDVFISYKEQSESGARTRDSAIAQDLYYQLVQQSYRVFFSRISLEDKLGNAYEPFIFSALNSAQVMIVLGTKPEHFNSVWVRNEWSRYLKLIKQDRSRVLIPCYRDMDPYDLPEELSLLQSLDMAKIGFIQDLIRGINKILVASKQKEAPSIKGIESKAQGGVNSLVERAFIFLADGDYVKADEYFERVLDQEPKNAKAYWGKFLAEYKCQEVEYLSANADESWFESNNYRKAVGFAQGLEKTEIEGYRTKVHDRIEQERLRREETERIRREEKERERLRTEEVEKIRREEKAKLQREQEKVLRRKGKKWLIGFIGVLLVGVSLWFLAFQDMVAYQQANTLMESGSYFEAYEEFSALDGYRDAKEKSWEAYRLYNQQQPGMGNRLEGFQWLLEQGYSKDTLYNLAMGFVENDDFNAAYPIFKVLVDDKDVQQKTLDSYAKAFPPSTVTFDSQGGSIVASIKYLVAGEKIDVPKPPTKRGCLFGGWYKDYSFVSKWDFNSDSVVQDITLYAKWIPYGVGDIGPAGGYIFYDKGSYSDGWRYLEAAPASYEFSGKVWGGYGTTVGGTGSAAGAGKGNTERIVSKFGNAEPHEKKTDYAAKVCSDLVVTKDGVSYDDWFLPSSNELDQMYRNLKKNNLGGFSVEGYWSSTEIGADDAWLKVFYTGYEGSYDRYSDYRVRPVRAF